MSILRHIFLIVAQHLNLKYEFRIGLNAPSWETSSTTGI